MKAVCAYCGSSHRVARFRGGDPLCIKHYLQMYNHGEIRDSPISRNTNAYVQEDDHAVIITKKGDRILIDTKDLPLVQGHSWCISKTGYAVSNIAGTTTKLHRLITNCPQSLVVDHVNGNPLDNRRRNLRICSAKDNSRNKAPGKNNTSKHIGVSMRDGKWHARIMVNRKEINLGSFDSLEAAVNARREAEIKHFGAFSFSQRIEALEP